MLTTFVIELAAAFYILFRYRMNTTAKLIVTTLGFLAFFQLAEYMVCKGAWGFSSLDWARFGYVAITMLPPLGIHLGLTITKSKNTSLLATAYASAAIFISFFLFVGHGMQGQECLGNYIIFSIAPSAEIPYLFYYYCWLTAGISFAWRAKQQMKDIMHQQALKWLAIGYASFIVPTTLVNIIDHRTLDGIPSIMCGFAVILALCLVFKVAPYALKEKNAETALEAKSLEYDQH